MKTPTNEPRVPIEEIISDICIGMKLLPSISRSNIYRLDAKLKESTRMILNNGQVFRMLIVEEPSVENLDEN